MNTIDLTSLKVITQGDIDAAAQQGAAEIAVAANAIITPSASESLAGRKIALRRGGAAAASGNGTAGAYGTVTGAATGVDPARLALFTSPEGEAVKEEICGVGRKLWMRQYVDGNGGNISYRIGPNEVICTPTLVSKADLRPQDLCLVDLEGNQLAGGRPRTSEILMHLEIYKAVPEAKAVVHCHPPHATAYAITGKVPPTCVIPEYEVFVGKVAVSPYETPGTQTFAETVIPFVKTHNTVLLSNHGIVCWGDTVTHAEWYVEVVDTYCWTLMLAAQLGTPLSHISSDKAADLLAIKKKLGLPDPRHEDPQCSMCDISERPGHIALEPKPGDGIGKSGGPAGDMDALVQAITEQVMAVLKNKQ
jgi:L-fuculose-phosphate aldolase